jgi:outer membrane immunogenic protein
MKIFTSCVVAFALLGMPALAAGAPMTNWSGFYVGGNVGGVAAHASGTSDFLDPVGGPILGEPTSLPEDNSPSDTSIIGGLQFGYNYQFSPMWVAGLEGDWDFTNTGYNFCRQTSRTGACGGAAPDGIEIINSNTHWLATFRARLGVTVGKFWLYGTGGAALGSVKTDVTLDCATGCGSSQPVVNQTGSSTDTAFGWVAGLGAEMAIDRNWSARIEWLHIDLGNIDSSLTVNGNTIGTPDTQTAVWSRSERYDVIRVGFDYLFAGD